MAAAVLLLASAPPSAVGGCDGQGWAYNTTNIEPDIQFIPGLVDPAGCCLRCAAAAGCGAFTANASGCGLKKLSWMKAAAGAVSGVVPSGPTTPPAPPAPSTPPPGPAPAPTPPTPSPPAPPAPPAPPGSCSLTESGPVTVSADGQVVENMRIVTTTKEPGIFVQGFKGVVIRNCTITHRAQTTATGWPYGVGIYITDSPDITISSVEVQLVDHPSGALPDLHNYNIVARSSSGVRISDVKVVGGSAGIELDHCDGAHVSSLVAVNMRGPYPRGQCFQCGYSDNVVLEDFYCKNDNTSWTEDNLSLYRSSNVTVRRGLIDGNNSPTGVGVMFEQDDPTKHGGLCEDVDTVHMGDGCFSAYGGTGIRFVRARCKDNHCDGWAGRAKATSGSLMYYAGDENGCNSTGISLEQSVYSGACAPGHIILSKDPGAWVSKDLVEKDFELRPVVSVAFCWDSQSGDDSV